MRHRDGFRPPQRGKRTDVSGDAPKLRCALFFALCHGGVSLLTLHTPRGSRLLQRPPSMQRRLCSTARPPPPTPRILPAACGSASARSSSPRCPPPPWSTTAASLWPWVRAAGLPGAGAALLGRRHVTARVLACFSRRAFHPCPRRHLGGLDGGGLRPHAAAGRLAGLCRLEALRQAQQAQPRWAVDFVCLGLWVVDDSTVQPACLPGWAVQAWQGGRAAPVPCTIHYRTTSEPLSPPSPPPPRPQTGRSGAATRCGGRWVPPCWRSCWAASSPTR